MLFKLVSLKVNASQNVQLAVTLRIEKKVTIHSQNKFKHAKVDAN